MINVDMLWSSLRGLEAEQQQKSIAVRGMQASQQKGAGSGDPTKRQSSLLKGLVSKFNQKTGAQAASSRAAGKSSKGMDLEFHANDATGEFSLPEFQRCSNMEWILT